MAKRKAGLHKEVTKIFQGVWIPQVDNIQNQSSISSIGSAARVYPKPLTQEHWPQQDKSSKKIQKAKLPKRTAWSFFSPKARRERKRLSSISRNLLINLPN